MIASILNLTCVNNPEYNKLMLVDVFNMKLIVKDNIENIDSGKKIELSKPLEQEEYQMEYKGCECRIEIDAFLSMDKYDPLSEDSYAAKILLRERYPDIDEEDKYRVIETAVTICIYPASLSIYLNIFEPMFFTNDTEDLIRNPKKAREVIPIAATDARIEELLKNKNIVCRYVVCEGKSYLLGTNFYDAMVREYTLFLDNELERLMDESLEYTICEKMQDKFYNRYRTNLKKLAKKRYGDVSLNFDKLSDLSIVFDLSMFDYLAYSVMHELGAALDSTVRDDYKYASFILNQSQIDCFKRLNVYDDRLINKRIKEGRIILKEEVQ